MRTWTNFTCVGCVRKYSTNYKWGLGFVCLWHGSVWLWPFVSLLQQFCCSAHYVIPPAALSLSLSVFLFSHFTPIFLCAACSTQTELKGWSHESDTEAEAPPPPLCQSEEERSSLEMQLLWLQSKTLHYFYSQAHLQHLSSSLFITAKYSRFPCTNTYRHATL